VASAFEAARAFFALPDERKAAAETCGEAVTVTTAGLWARPVPRLTAAEATCGATLVAARWTLLEAAKRSLKDKVATPLRDELLKGTDDASLLTIRRRKKNDDDQSTSPNLGLLSLVVPEGPGLVQVRDGGDEWRDGYGEDRVAAVTTGATLTRVTNGAFATSAQRTAPGDREGYTLLLHLKTDATLKLLDGSSFDAGAFQRSYGSPARATPNNDAETTKGAKKPPSAKTTENRTATETTPEKTLTLILRDETDTTCFLVRPTTKLLCVMRSYCSRMGIPEHSLRPLYYGKRVTPYRTPADYDMRDGDVIDVMLEVTGD